jgi:hypothetical protein
MPVISLPLRAEHKKNSLNTRGVWAYRFGLVGVVSSVVWAGHDEIWWLVVGLWEKEKSLICGGVSNVTNLPFFFFFC